MCLFRRFKLLFFGQGSTSGYTEIASYVYTPFYAASSVSITFHCKYSVSGRHLYE